MHLKHRTVGLGLHRHAAAAAAACVAMLLAAGSEAAAAPAPAPAWRLGAIAAPTNFLPGEAGTLAEGPLYRLEATNVGGAPTSAPVTLEAVLPPGISPSIATASINDHEVPGPSCSISSEAVTCTTAAAIRPGFTLSAEIAVDTEAGLAGTPSAEATVSGGGAAPAKAAIATAVTSASPGFDFLPGDSGLASRLTEADGSPAGLAGSHPYQLTASLGFPIEKGGEQLFSHGHSRDVLVDLPHGFVVTPTATPELCTEEQLITASCPLASQIGVATAIVSVVGVEGDAGPIFNMVPPPGSVSNFGLNVGDVGVFIHLLGSVRSGDYGLSAAAEDLPAIKPLLGLRFEIWGDPSSHSHDAVRSAGVPPQPRALLTLPSACGPLATTAWADSWEAPGAFVERSVENADLEGNPVAVSGCGELPFAPTLMARPTTPIADSPSGFDVDLTLARNDAPEARASADLRRAEVTLPEGLVANPAGANGLEGCSPAQVGLASPTGTAPARFDGAPATCPAASRIGSSEIETPLLDHPLDGSVYLASPDDNPFGSLLALYITAEDPASGVVVKLAGEVRADPASGRLTATFDELPELPIASVALRLFGGATAPLRTPAACGAYATVAALTPWSAPESGPPAAASDGYPISRAPAGSPCAGSEGALPNSPTLEAGTISPGAGASTPFVLDLRRADGTQRLASLKLMAPQGLIANLAGIPYCPETALAAAAGRAGRAEQANPSCPAATRVGTATVGAGAGPTPYYVNGGAYLAGPYRGAPLSLAAVVPAVAGPFDLGVAVVRSALHIDPRTAAVTAVSDPLPQILRGIPLDVRSLRVSLDRSRFIRNPTSCNPTAVEALASSTEGADAGLSSRFQMGGCRRLAFRPRVSLRLLGSADRGAHPRLRTVLRARRGDAGIRRLAVALPRTELLDSRGFREICSRERFAAGACPASSLAGHLIARTPLLDRPLEGPVYLRSSDGRLPDLAAALHGQVDLAMIARIDSVGGRLRTTFGALPDVPLDKVVLTLSGGRSGLLVNSGGLCGRRHRATVELDAQNGKARGSGPILRVSC
jgi:hypothetical protein